MTSKEEELEQIIENALLTVGTRDVELAGLNVKRLGVFVEVLKDRRRFVELYWSS